MLLPVKLHHIVLMIGNFLAWSDSGMSEQDTDVNKSVAQLATLIKDEVLITVDCPIFPSILIAKYLSILKAH
jgi:hypothetical protein